MVWRECEAFNCCEEGEGKMSEDREDLDHVVRNVVVVLKGAFKEFQKSLDRVNETMNRFSDALQDFDEAYKELSERDDGEEGGRNPR